MELAQLKKAEHLLSQDRFGEAKNEIKQYLSSDPENVGALIMLVQAYLGLDQHENADKVADDILKLDASNPVVLYLKGITQVGIGKSKNALKFLDNALSIDPNMVDAHGVRAVIFYGEAKFEEALAAANAGLALDPHHQLCLNQRSRALLKLGRTELHLEADKQALKNNPMSAQTHATVGWSELEKGDIKKAKDHFREALRLDPNDAYARSGMLHAIKSTNWFYRLFMMYLFWMQGLKPNVRWAVVIIGYLLIVGLNRYSGELGMFTPVAKIIIYLYMIFAISTWIIGSVSNIFLRFHSFGKYLLSESEIKAANKSAVLLGLAIAGGIFQFVMRDQVVWHNVGFFLVCSGVALTIIVSSIENASLEKSRRNLTRAGIAFAIAFAILMVLSLTLPGLALRFFNWLIYGFIAYQFYANTQQ